LLTIPSPTFERQAKTADHPDGLKPMDYAPKVAVLPCAIEITYSIIAKPSARNG
jgi:hypothetical protein